MDTGQEERAVTCAPSPRCPATHSPRSTVDSPAPPRRRPLPCSAEPRVSRDQAGAPSQFSSKRVITSRPPSRLSAVRRNEEGIGKERARFVRNPPAGEGSREAEGSLSLDVHRSPWCQSAAGKALGSRSPLAAGAAAAAAFSSPVSRAADRKPSSGIAGDRRRSRWNHRAFHT